MKFPFQCITLVIALCSAANADELLPAVSSVNGKMDYQGGWMESSEGHNFSGSMTFPLGTRFGLQADALYTRVSGREFFGGAGHLFWRNPEVGLLGITGGAVHTEDVLNSYQALVEGEYYMGQFTIRALAGVGNISYDVPVPFINSDPTRFVGSAMLDWYAMDNLRIGAGYAYLFENHLGRAQVEYQTPWKGLCFTAEYARGENDYDHGLVGVRFYFGKDKSLKERHRQDDPPSLPSQIVTGIGLYGAEFNKRRNQKTALANPSGWSISPPAIVVPSDPQVPIYSGNGSSSSSGSYIIIRHLGPIPQIPALPIDRTDLTQ